MPNNQTNFSKKETTMSGITQRVVTEGEGLAALVQKMSAEDVDFYYSFGRDKPSGHHQPHAAFLDRVFYIYQCQGKDHNDHQRPPKVEAVVRVINMSFTIDRGMEIVLLNETTNEKQIVSAVPARAFGFPVFVQVPNSTALRWNKVVRSNGEENWEPSVGMFIKTANDPKFFSKGNIYMLPSKDMSRLYSDSDWRSEKFEHELDKPDGTLRIE